MPIGISAPISIGAGNLQLIYWESVYFYKKIPAKSIFMGLCVKHINKPAATPLIIWKE
jgi:hypothetical protein